MTMTLDPPRQADAANLPEIAALLDEVFPQAQGGPHLPDLEWLYLRHPLGRAWYVNARDANGALIAHYAVMASAPLDAEPYASLRTFFSLNTAVHPGAKVPGLMVLTARTLFKHLQSLGPTLILGAANENSFIGFTRFLGFRSLGRLALRGVFPYMLPRRGAPRALRFDEAVLRWRVERPGTRMFAVAQHGAVLRCGMKAHGLPMDAILSVDLPREAVARLSLPEAPRTLPSMAPRLYASFPPDAPGIPVPERLRPSPLEYIFRLLAPGV